MNETLGYLIAAAAFGVIIMMYFIAPNTSNPIQNKSLFPGRALGGSFIHIDRLSGRNPDDAEAVNRAHSIYRSGIALTSEASKSFDACIYNMTDKNTMEKLVRFSSEILMRGLRKNLKFDVKENKELFKARNVEFATAKLATDVQLTKFSDNPAQFLSQQLGKENIKDFAKIGEGTFTMKPTYLEVDLKTSYITLSPGIDTVAYAPFEQNGILFAKDDGTAIIVNFFLDGYFFKDERACQWRFFDDKVQALYVLDAIFADSF